MLQQQHNACDRVKYAFRRLKHDYCKGKDERMIEYLL